MVFHGYRSFGFGLTPAVRMLLWITAGAFVLQWLCIALFGDAVLLLFGLSRHGMHGLWIWQLITYMFLHSSIWHIFFNMLALYFFGPDVERTVGRRRFIFLYLIWGVFGGLGWLLISARDITPCIGASGAIFGVLGMFSALFPHRPITLLLFLVVPVTFRARTLAILLGAITLFMMMTQPGQIAHAAHLIGGVAGYGYGLLWMRGGLKTFRFDPAAWWNTMLWHWQRRRFKVVSGSFSKYYNAPKKDPDTDAILDKVSKFGLGSLTQREREILEQASRR